MGNAKGLAASRFLSLACMKCGVPQPVQTQSRCPRCGGILDAKYDTGGGLPDTSSRSSMWDFSELISPVPVGRQVSMGEGWTPFVDAPNFGKRLGMKSVRFKVEGSNPTGAFKDRALSVGVSLAVHWKRAGAFTASDGNAGASAAAYAARAGMKCVIIVEGASAQKLAQTSMYSPIIVRVSGLYSSLSNLESALAVAGRALPGWMNLFLWAPVNPLLVDPFKTIAYEIASTGRVPDVILVPVAGGDLLYGIHKGFMELREMGRVARLPKLVAVQGEGADPTVRAIEQALEAVPETEPPRTVAAALKVNFGAEHALKAVRESRGFGVTVSDEKILRAQSAIARDDGIFCEISSAVVVAAIEESLASGRIDRDQEVAAVLTGGGLKDYPSSLNISDVPHASSTSDFPSALRRLLRPHRVKRRPVSL